MNMELPEPQVPSLNLAERRSLSRKWRWWIIGSIAALLVVLGLGTYSWYQAMLAPVTSKGQIQSFTIKSGDTSSSVGQKLAQAHLIKSQLAFVIFMRLHGGELRIGAYRLSPASSTPQIAEHLIAGKQDSYSVTFFPGATLTSPSTTPSDQRTDVTTVLERAGFSQDEIKAALAKQYDSPLFEGKPSGTSLEGYIYGETYQIDVGTSVDTILGRTFDTFWQAIEKENLPAGFKAHGLTIYQAITLASIIERESDNATDQKQIAQIFYLRLAQGMPLGSDVTFIYAANQLGVIPSPTLDSPYNTRIKVGLPPGPIATPGLTALEAVANPSPGDYLYFLAGDDGKIHYAKTNAEHEQNIAKYCQKLCS